MKIYKNFISFEGIDYSGKSTQIQELQKKLQQNGIETIIVREPGGTTISEKIRDLLLSNDHSEMHRITEFLLYEAARAQLVHQKILPLLDKNIHIIADRFFDSTTAYQGYGRKLNLEVIQTINRFATSNLLPYRTFFIDISPEEAEKRHQYQKRNKDRLEKSGIPFYQLIQAGFSQMCLEEPERFIRIDGEREPAEIAADIWSHIAGIWPVKA